MLYFKLKVLKEFVFNLVFIQKHGKDISSLLLLAGINILFLLASCLGVQESPIYKLLLITFFTFTCDCELIVTDMIILTYVFLDGPQRGETLGTTVSVSKPVC